MKSHSFSIKFVTSFIFAMLGVIAIALSLLAGEYFKKAAINAQSKSLSRVIEVAAHEIIMQLKERSYELGSKLSNDKHLLQLMNSESGSSADQLVDFLDDPLLNGFVGFSKIDLRKLRVFNLDLQFLAESEAGIKTLQKNLNPYLVKKTTDRKKTDRLKAVDALWISPEGPLFSTLIPIGGLRPLGYLEIIVDPAFNLSSITDITQTPITVSPVDSVKAIEQKTETLENMIPVEFLLRASDDETAFSIVGYEDISRMNEDMETALFNTIAGFIVLTFIALVAALWIFRHLLFIPVSNMIADIKQISHGNLDKQVSIQGLSEFRLLANAFNSMTEKIQKRTDDLLGLLDVDENVLMCFGSDDELIYFNKKALSVFGYSHTEFEKLYLADLFSDDIEQAVQFLEKNADKNQNRVQSHLICKHKDSKQFRCTANISAVYIMQQHGLAITINTGDGKNLLDEKDSKLLSVVEHAFSTELDTFSEDPGSPASQGTLQIQEILSMGAERRKSFVRDYVVKIMNTALTCWSQELGKNKIDLAEESNIWPVYIDKSTPTTRTLDKYLSLDLCPKNPRAQRVIETAEFVLSKTSDSDNENIVRLKGLLDDFRILLAGIQ